MKFTKNKLAEIINHCRKEYPQEACGILAGKEGNIEEIYPNMSATANIITATKNDVLLVPTAAVQTQNDQTYVRVLKNGKIQQVDVETDLSSSTQIEITSGLSEGDNVITSTVSSTTSGSSTSTSPFSSFGRGGFGGGGAVRRD